MTRGVVTSASKSNAVASIEVLRRNSLRCTSVHSSRSICALASVAARSVDPNKDERPLSPTARERQESNISNDSLNLLFRHKWPDVRLLQAGLWPASSSRAPLGLTAKRQVSGVPVGVICNVNRSTGAPTFCTFELDNPNKPQGVDQHFNCFTDSPQHVTWQDVQTSTYGSVRRTGQQR
jgi:hypothetical protein